MKRYLCAIAALTMSMAVSAAGLGDVKTVYVLPMSNGLDQYLAVQLTAESVLQVVTDPRKADVVLTDHVGESFEQSLAELNRKPHTGDKAADAAADATEDKGAPVARSGGQGRRGRGTIFLVNRTTHDVLWSVYELPKDNGPGGLRRTAGKITAKLAQAIKGK